MLKTGRSDKRLCAFVMNNTLKLITEKNVPFVNTQHSLRLIVKAFQSKIDCLQSHSQALDKFVNDNYSLNREAQKS